MGIQVCLNEGPCPFPSGNSNQIAKIHWQTLKIFLRTNQTWHKAFLGTRNSSLFEWRAMLFSRGDTCNNEIAKIHWRFFKTFFYVPRGQFQPNLAQSILGWLGVVCSNEGPRPFLRGYNNEIAKIHWRTSKIFFLRTTGPISTRFGTKHRWVMGNHVCSNEGPRSFPRGDNNEIVTIYWQTLKIIFHRTKLSTKHPWLMNKDHSVFKEKIISFFSFGLILRKSVYL